VRAVLDANVLISALLSPRGTPARLVRAWRDGAYELIVSPLLLAEVRRSVTAYPKLSRRISAAQVDSFVSLLSRAATNLDDALDAPPHRSRDPKDEYVLALAAAARAAIVSGDRHLLDVSDRLPVYDPAQFMALLEREQD
jgi:uncharacterized protein